MSGLLQPPDEREAGLFGDLARLPWDQLIQLRLQHPEAAAQQQLAPYEHRAYAREEVGRNPLLAPAYLAMVPGYQLFKLLSGGARTAPALQQLGHGWLGVAEGLRDAWRRD